MRLTFLKLGLIVECDLLYLIQMGIILSMRALANDQSVEEAATSHGRLWIKSGNSRTGKTVVRLVSITYPLVILAAIYM